MTESDTKLILLCGVAGSGKSTIGLALARKWQCVFVDADDLHSQQNIAKMKSGESLSDKDREPWLKKVRQQVSHNISRGQTIVLACSALKQQYRDFLAELCEDTIVIYLRVNYDLARHRIINRTRHFFNPDGLEGQFLDLEEPKDVTVIEGKWPVEKAVSFIDNLYGEDVLSKGEKLVSLGMVGTGRMGTGMIRRIIRKGITCTAYDISEDARSVARAGGANIIDNLKEMIEALHEPRIVWLMLPQGDATDKAIEEISPLLVKNDIIIDGGNAYYRDSVRRASELAQKGILFIDCGVSGGIWGEERGYCLMLGGEPKAVEYINPILEALSPDLGGLNAFSGKTAEAARGYLHCGPAGAGHFAKMVHNAIEYGMMQAIGEGFELLKKSGSCISESGVGYTYDIASIAELWRHGSVISSWLIELSARALASDPDLSQYQGKVVESGEARWALEVAKELSVYMPVVNESLQARASSFNTPSFSSKLISALRGQFGGHKEKNSL